ncbi:PP2C family protein-serine/threonine phosphatase [Parafrankia discariae]|uniref:PP2C family protein-serine/threonine phosphatase n=1 Tax=Parafrankia discariae TaxID=365528 RepID=UPI0005509EDF|nr:fused response regulator/phosphatase [Parafrankia discariae]
MVTERAVILVVDDSESKRYILGSWLRRTGYLVVEAATGGEALLRLAERPPDLAVLDVHLPDMSGIEVCRRIKGDRVSAAVPVLHVSAIAVDSADRSAGLDEGADAYLVDPIEPKEFLATVGALLRQSRRFAEEHRIAHTLQRSLLPAGLPDLPGLRVAARYHASADHAEIGGDFFDAFDTPAGDAVLVIGDVQGHSLAAAVIMAELRYSLRAYAFDGQEPRAVVERLNRLMLAHHPESTATVCVVVLPPDRSSATVVNAGHLPPLLVGRDGVRYWNGGAGVLLGIEAPPPEADSISLDPGARLLLFTDGLVERRSSPLTETMAAFADSVEAAHRAPGARATAGGPLDPARLPIQDLADGLIAAADESDDDVALVAFETTADRS